jgi:hypothetical protein
MSKEEEKIKITAMSNWIEEKFQMKPILPACQIISPRNL